MKKLLLIALFAIGNLMCSYAQQNDTVLYIENYQDGDRIPICVETYPRVLIYAESGCNAFTWYVYGFQNTDNPVIIESNTEETVLVRYYGCDIPERAIRIVFKEGRVPNSFTHTAWKRNNETLTLKAVESDSLDYPFEYQFHWSTGETTNEIEVSDTGTYTCEVIDACGTATRTFIVRDNVELYRATCDLRSNLNQVTWLTTPAQAEYISAVNIYRNTYQLVATVPYLDGSFTDNIGSESTQWQYHIVGVDNEGNECPIPSYWKRTIHLDHVQGTGGGEILQWTPYEEENPAKNTVIYYSIYDVVDGEPQHVMDVGNFTNVYAYNPADFDGYGTVAAVFEGKGRDMEDLAFSNLTAEVLDVGEVSSTNFSVYPNPTNGTFTVEGAKTLTIYNAIGQVVARSDNENYKHSLTLAPGVYFILSDEGIAKKIVVE